jgi:hypothetical protein
MTLQRFAFGLFEFDTRQKDLRREGRSIRLDVGSHLGDRLFYPTGPLRFDFGSAANRT